MGKRTCETCGDPVKWSGVGRPPKYCLEHRPQRKRDLKTLEARAARNRNLEPNESGQYTTEFDKDRRSAKDASKREGARRAELAAKAGRARMLAIGLALDVDPITAAASVGLEVDSEELEKLTESAKTNHADLMKLDTASIGRMLLAAVGQCAIRLFETASTIAPSQLPGAIRQAVQALEMLQGDTGPVVSDLNMIFRIEGGEDWNPDQLIPNELKTPNTKSEGSA